MIDGNPGFWTPDEPPHPLEEVLPYIEPLPDRGNDIRVGISGRHIHLAREHLEQLFGKGYKLTHYKDLSQPGQFASRETLTVVGPKGVLEGVRILAPLRDQTQVEISGTDGYHLGIDPPVRDSGDLEGTPGVVLVGPKGAVTLRYGLILAATHIHMSPGDAERLGLRNGDRVQVLVDGERDLIFNEVLVRVSDRYKTEMHMDTDEANAAVIEDGDLVQIIGKHTYH
ncbi:MAG: phosphate propanoyltransferase [Bacillota bacterium]